MVEKVKEEKDEKRIGEKGVSQKTMKPVSLFQFLREKPVLQSIMEEYEARKAGQPKLNMA